MFPFPETMDCLGIPAKTPILPHLMNDSELHQLLKAAGSPVQPAAGFKRDVWSRIEAADETARNRGFSRTLERFFGIFALPPVAVATCTVMVLAGAWFGLESASQHPASEIGYVQSISPFAQTHR